MSFFPILNIDDVLASLFRKAKRDVTSVQELEEELFSKQADKSRIALRLREILPTAFDLPYIENVIFPALVTAAYRGERLSLPMTWARRLTPL